jgi:hypothetical protein
VPGPVRAVQETGVDCLQQQFRLQRRACGNGGLGRGEQAPGADAGVRRQLRRPRQEGRSRRMATACRGPVGDQEIQLCAFLGPALDMHTQHLSPRPLAAHRVTEAPHTPIAPQHPEL